MRHITISVYYDRVDGSESVTSEERTPTPGETRLAFTTFNLIRANVAMIHILCFNRSMQTSEAVALAKDRIENPKRWFSVDLSDR